MHRAPIAGLHTDAFALTAEVIEVGDKPAQPWGNRAQAAFGEAPPRTGTGTVRQAIVALGRQDVDVSGLAPPVGTAVLGMSSDHLVLDVGDHRVGVGDELGVGLAYGALVRAMTSPFVAKTSRSARGHLTHCHTLVGARHSGRKDATPGRNVNRGYRQTHVKRDRLGV